MITPERNDVDIEVLFKWYDEFDIDDLDGQHLETVFMRILGDADMNKTRVMALRKSAELRKKLRDPKSDEHIAYISDPEDLERDKLIEFLILSLTRQMYTDVLKEVKIPFPKEPESGATLEQQEKYQQLVDAYPETVSKEVSARVDAFQTRERKNLESLSIEELYKKYVNQAINDLCETEMYDQYSDYCAYYGSYKDVELKERRFATQEEFENLPYRIKKQYSVAYKQLELNTTQLKK